MDYIEGSLDAWRLVFLSEGIEWLVTGYMTSSPTTYPA